MSSVIADIAGAKARLSKRATFEAAANDLCSIANGPELEDGGAQMDWWLACRRAHLLLKTRFTSPAFWNAGRRLFHAAQALPAAAQVGDEVESWLSDCRDALGDEAGPQRAGSPTAAAAGPLFEGQLSAGQSVRVGSLSEYGQALQTLLSQLVAGGEGATEEGGTDGGAQLPQPLQQLLPPQEGAATVHTADVAQHTHLECEQEETR